MKVIRYWRTELWFPGSGVGGAGVSFRVDWLGDPRAAASRLKVATDSTLATSVS